jgi:predicted nucleotidyltransferase
VGGGGGGGGSPGGEQGLDRLRERAAEQVARAQFDSEVNARLDEELPNLNSRDVELVRQRLDELKEALGDEVDEIDRVLFGGSIAKHTFVDGLSDVDVLVMLNEVTDLSPAAAKEQFANALREHLGDRAEVTVGKIAVTVQYRDGLEVQLLPAIQQGDHRAISSPDGSEWVQIRPGNFARRLTDVNKAQAGAAIPAIKLAKAIIARELAEPDRPSGYHVEALSVAAFANYRGPRDPKSMLTHFFGSAANDVLKPIPDVTGQSERVDAYLGAGGSAPRTRVSAAFQAIAERMEHSTNLDDWSALLD